MSQHGNLSLQGADDPCLFLTAQTGAQKFLQRCDAIAVHAPQGMGQLIGVPAPLDDQGRVNQRYGMVDGDAQPQIVVLAYRKAFIEATHLIKKIFRQHDGGRADQA